MKIAIGQDKFMNDYLQAEFDQRINYPCYKSFDDLIDLPRLLSLNEYIEAGIVRHQMSTAQDYFVNLYRLDEESPYQPGQREIWLSRLRPGLPEEYSDRVDNVELWEPTDAAADLPLLMSFIETLPFETTGRILIIYDDSANEVPAHRDHLDPEVCNEFIWFRTNRNKPFYLLNNRTGEKEYVQSFSAWFDTVNQYHGCDAAPGLSFSFRVDGVFNEEFRNRIPRPAINAASTPALWASI